MKRFFKKKIETVFGYFKNKLELEHTMHRSQINFGHIFLP